MRQLVPGRDIAIFEITMQRPDGDGLRIEFGQYLMISKDGEWDFLWSHHKEELLPQLQLVHELHGLTVMLTQINPPLPDAEDKSLTYELDANEEIL